MGYFGKTLEEFFPEIFCEDLRYFFLNIDVYFLDVLLDRWLNKSFSEGAQIYFHLFTLEHMKKLLE